MSLSSFCCFVLSFDRFLINVSSVRFLNLTYIYLLCECAVLYTVSFLSVFILYRVLKSVIRRWVNKAKNIVVELRLMEIKKHFVITLFE